MQKRVFLTSEQQQNKKTSINIFYVLVVGALLSAIATSGLLQIIHYGNTF